jgi:hypothetical protein
MTPRKQKQYPAAKKKYWEKNTYFKAPLPNHLYHFFLDYLQKYCPHDSTPKQFKFFVLALEELDSKGTNFVNPRGEYEKKKDEEFTARYGNQDPENICLRSQFYATKSPEDKKTMCKWCKDNQISLFNECQKTKEKARREFKK